MIIWEACVEEIALEGLDGITLPTLWQRLQSRPDMEFVFDEAGKQWTWNFVRQRRNILSFYQLPESRPPLSLGGDDDVYVDEKLIYPIRVITEGDLWGSCSTIDTRLDVTDQICQGDNFKSLNTALEHFGIDRLVVVASQIERSRALIPSSCNAETFFQEHNISRIHYAMLERIGRSRYSGVNAGSTDSLHALFNLRAKDVFYVVKRFDALGIVKKQTEAITGGSHTKTVTATNAMLTRFCIPLERSRYLTPMRKLIDFLEKKPNKTAEYNEVKELFAILTVHYVKRMLYSFPNIIKTHISRVEVPVILPPCQRKNYKKAQKIKKTTTTNIDTANDLNIDGAIPLEDMTDLTVPPENLEEPEMAMKPRTFRYYELVGKLNFDEETGVLLSRKGLALDESTADGGGDDDDDDNNAAALAGDNVIDWSRFNPYRTRVYEALRVVRQAGAQGVDNRTIRQEIGVDRKQMERLVNNLKKGTQFKGVVENSGKTRRTKYVWSNAEHQAEQYFKKFEEMTQMNLSSLGDKEKLMLGERNIRRMISILEKTESVLVLNSVDHLRALRRIEQEEGYGHVLDRKCLLSLLKFLSTHGLLKTFITIVNEGPLTRTVEFVCHKNIVLNSPELQSKISAMRGEMANLNQKRMPAHLKPQKEKAKLPLQSDGILPQLPSDRELQSSNIDLSALIDDVIRRRSHPAVQRQLQKRTGREEDIERRPAKKAKETLRSVIEREEIDHDASPILHLLPPPKKRRKRRKIGEPAEVDDATIRKRNRNRPMDAIDLASMARKRKMRAQFTNRERQMLLLMRAVSYVFYAGSKLWVDSHVIRDLMHKYIPESLDKSAKTLIQASSRDVGTNPQAGESMLIMAEQLQKHKKIKVIKKRLGNFKDLQEGKRWAFEKAFEIAQKMFYGDNRGIDLNDLNLDTIYQTFDVSVEKGLKSISPMSDAIIEGDVLENTIKRIIYSAVSISRRDGIFTPHLNMIYRSLPDTVLFKVISRLKRYGMLVVFKIRGANDPKLRKVPIEAIPKKRGDLSLSFFYRHFFYHHYHATLTKEARTLSETMTGRPDDWHNVLNESPGNIPALLALLSNKQVYFDLTVPSNVVVYSDSEDANRENEEADDDWPRIISATTNLLQNEDEDDDDIGLSMPSTSTSNQQLKNPPITVKTEPGTEAVHVALNSANKSFVYKLRQERLTACESSDSRSIALRVRDLTLNSCSLVAKLSGTFKDNTANEQKKIRDALIKLIKNMAVEENKEISQESGGNMDSMEKTIRETLDGKGVLGMMEEEFKEIFGDDESARSRLNELIEKRDVFICGVAKKRYVYFKHMDFWTIKSMRIPKDDRMRVQMAGEASMEELRGDPVKFMPRPWLKPDGTLNKPMLRWICEGLFLRYLSMPCVTDSYIQEQFSSVLDPRETDELTDFLIDAGCLTRVEREFVRRQPQLFGPPLVEKIIMTSYEVPMDGIIKFASIFERTPMPDFVHGWLMGASGSDRGSVFGRRRINPMPLTVTSNGV